MEMKIEKREVAEVGSGWWVLLLLSALMGFGSISTDLYLPAMPLMGQSLGADMGTMEWTISGYLIGFSLGQLLWGPLGDRLGRRLPVAIGLVLFIVGSGGCALTDTAWHMIGWRVVQAVGACSGVVLSRAMVRDLYQGARAAQMLSTLLLIMAVTPLLGPLVGGQILQFAGWRAIFWVLTGVGALTLGALFTIPETLREEDVSRESWGRIFTNYGRFLKNRTLFWYTVTGSFFYAGMFAYVAGTPFAYISYYRVPEKWYGGLFAIGIVGIMISNVVNARLLRRVSVLRLVKWGGMGMLVFSVLLVVQVVSGWGGLPVLVGIFFAYMAMYGVIIANSISGALAEFPAQSGTASALIGAVQYGSGVVSSLLVGVFADGTLVPLGMVMGVAGLGCFLCSLKLVERLE